MSSTELAEEVIVPDNVGDLITSEPGVYLGNVPQSNPDTIAVTIAEDNKGESNSESEADGSEADGNEPKIRRSWQSSTRLYCPKNGRSHSLLVDFGCSKCPMCWEDLKYPTHEKGLRRLDPTVPDISEEDSEEDTEENTSEVGDSPTFTFTLQYKDTEGNTITTEPWGKEPFNLQAARGAIEMKKSSTFEVVTVLQTTIPEYKHRGPFGTRELLDGGILNNPTIGLTVETAKIVIRSPEIIRSISHVVSYYPSVDLEGDMITMKEPYPLIAHHMEQLERYSKQQKDITIPESSTQISGNRPSLELEIPIKTSEDRSDYLDLLLNYVKDSVYKDDIRDEIARYDRMACTFRMLWFLFKPGDTVYCETGGTLAAYVVSHVEMDDGILSESPRKEPYTVNVWSLDFDGRFVGRYAEDITIPHFEGERSITSLKVFPCEYLDMQDNGQTRRRLEQHGKQWYESIIGRQVYYSGRLPDFRNKTYHGRVYVDSVSYYSENPSSAPEVGVIEDMGTGLSKCYCEECKGQRSHPPIGFRWATYDVLNPFRDRDLETDGLKEPRKHRYLLCNQELWGLMLKTRTWARLDIANCSVPKANTRAIENLVMPEDRKTMIKALVQRFTNDSTKPKGQRLWLADFMENKGEGQIFLLHGGPGVGKTFCIAEYTGRALLSLTGGDIGTDETQVERNLAKWFKLAETWGAVMLIDEADVYLERREFADLKRNSLVSVFLRCIEYYRGILFLTTNRVGTFDDAFMSRIHVVIAYENLTSSDRTRIWKQFFNKLSEDRQDMTVTSRAKRYVLEDESVTNLDWNGREIRNAFQTAVTLAEYRFQQKEDKAEDEGPVLDQTDFEQVLDMTFQFREYLTKVHGATADERAYNMKSRLGPSE
ncbi:hypothetical protein F5Y10DRAFT_284378 [Nemania abortiva]|nr:hypothetical protein F5Y10DRAFT_284378 [Nemania abortiva]